MRAVFPKGQAPEGRGRGKKDDTRSEKKKKGGSWGAISLKNSTLRREGKIIRRGKASLGRKVYRDRPERKG